MYESGEVWYKSAKSGILLHADHLHINMMYHLPWQLGHTSFDSAKMSLNLQSLRIVDDKDETRQENGPPIGSNLIQQLLDQPAPAQHEPEVPEVQIVRPTAGMCIYDYILSKNPRIVHKNRHRSGWKAICEPVPFRLGNLCRGPTVV